MLKNLKLGIKITLLISIVVAICIIGLYYVSNNNMTTAMKNSAQNTMDVSINAKTQIIDDYIVSAETVLKAFSTSGELWAFVNNPTNEKLRKEAQKYNEKYYASIGAWEGIYLDTWDSTVITHSNPKVPGMIMRKGDNLKKLQDSILASDGVYNVGIMQSPASGQIVMSMYVPLMKDKKPIGFVGGAVLAESLKNLLDASTIKGMENATYSLININTNKYIFDSNEELISTDITDENVLKIVDNIRNNDSKIGSLDYTIDGKEYFSVYKSLASRGWALIITDETSEIYSSTIRNRNLLGMFCTIAFIFIVIISIIVIHVSLKPLAKVLRGIKNLKNLDLSENDEIKGYVGTKSEVGMLADAVQTLTEVFRDIINTLNKCSFSLAESSNTMTGTSKELFESVSNSASTTEQLSTGIINTNESINTVTSELVKMNKMVSKIEQSIKDGNVKSQKLIETSNAMSIMADTSLEGNNNKMTINKSNIENTMKELENLSKINEIATQILDITSQTNLLSLNASIEAARAGEAGRGFAVVAGEMGFLAESSTQAVSQIQAICQEANESIINVRACFDELVTFMESDVSEKFTEFASMAREYGDAVKDIRDAIDTIKELASSFIHSVQNISNEIDNVKDVSTDNEAGIEVIIKQTNSTTETADSIVNIANQNQNNAEAIKSIIDQFGEIR